MTLISIFPVINRISESDAEYPQTSIEAEFDANKTAIVYELESIESDITTFVSNVSESEESDDVFRSTQSISKGFYYYTSFSYNGSTHIVKLTEELQRFLYEKCQVYNVDYELVLAIIGCESGWDVNVVSDGQYYGLGMISTVAMPQLSSELGITNLSDPKQNMEAICFLMAEKLIINDNSIPAALMSYNKGQTGAEVYFKQGIYETGYTIKVLGFQEAMKNTKINSSSAIVTDSIVD